MQNRNKVSTTGCKVSSYLDEIKDKIDSMQKKYNNYYDDAPDNNNMYDKLLYAFRGESMDYGKTALMPSIFRDYTYLKKEKHLFELLCDYNLMPLNASNIEKAIEAQHYIAISRMLDITFDALSSLYFACESNKDHDAILYVFGFPKHYSPHSNYIQDFYTKMLEHEHVPYSRNFKVFTHSYSNERIKAQKGGFIFFAGSAFNPINKCYYETVNIKAADKNDLLTELKLIFNIDKASIYPEKENIAQLIKATFTKNSYDMHSACDEHEIDSCIERLMYELSLCNKSTKERLRIIRKEKLDLESYVLNDIRSYDKTDKNKDDLIEYIREQFKHLRVQYGEKQNDK